MTTITFLGSVLLDWTAALVMSGVLLAAQTRLEKGSRSWKILGWVAVSPLLAVAALHFVSRAATYAL